MKELKQLSNSLDRPYLNQFDHLLPPTKQQKVYDDLFGAPTQQLPDLQPLLNEDDEPVEEGYYDEEASEHEVKRNRRKKYLPDD